MDFLRNLFSKKQKKVTMNEIEANRQDPTAILIAELVEIGVYVDTPGDGYDKHHNNKRARQIGELLNQTGGMELMLKAHSAVVEQKGRTAGRELESCWNGIGGWRG